MFKVDAKASDVKIERINPHFGNLDSAFLYWKQNHQDAHILAMTYGDDHIGIIYKEEPQPVTSEVEDQAQLPLLDRLKKVVIEEMRKEAEKICFKEFDGEGCFTQLCNDMEHRHGVGPADFFEVVENFIGAWSEETKYNCVR